MAMGRLFWAIIASIGLVSASAFIHYDRHYNKKNKTKSKDKGFFKAFDRYPFISKVSANLPLLFIPVILIANSTSSGSDLGIPPVSPLQAGLHNFYSWILLLVVLLAIVFGYGRKKYKAKLYKSMVNGGKNG